MLVEPLQICLAPTEWSLDMFWDHCPPPSLFKKKTRKQDTNDGVRATTQHPRHDGEQRQGAKKNRHLTAKYY